MTPTSIDPGRIAYLQRELVMAARDYYIRSDLTHLDRDCVRVAQRLGDLLDAIDNAKDPTQ